MVLIGVAAFVLSAPGSARAALTLKDRGPIAEEAVTAAVDTDGERYIASGFGRGPVSVLDVRTGARRTIPQFGGCFWRDIHGEELLWACPAPSPMQYGVVQNIGNGQVQTLPALASIPQSASPLEWNYADVGDRFAAISGSGYHEYFTTFVDRRTQVQRQIPRPRRDRVVDLDGPRLTRKLCQGQRSGLDYDDIGARVPGPLAMAGSRAAALVTGDRQDRLELQRCGTKIRTVRVMDAGRLSQPVITSRFIAWTETTASPSGARTRVVVRFHRSGKLRRSALMSLRTDLQLLLVGHRLFAVKTTFLPGFERRLQRVAV